MSKINYNYKAEKKALSLRISTDLYEKINKFAKSERRTMTNAVECLLYELFNEKTQ
jgi:hypothetical protein